MSKTEITLTSPLIRGLASAALTNGEETVLQIRDAHPAWGGRKIRARMVALKEKTIPSASTITAILRRNNRIRPEDSQKSKPFGSFERPEPNDLWQMDFKGEFRMGNRKYCYPLTVLDDHSRYSIGLVACAGQTFVTVQTHLTEIFRRYGLPRLCRQRKSVGSLSFAGRSHAIDSVADAA